MISERIAIMKSHGPMDDNTIFGILFDSLPHYFIMPYAIPTQHF